MIVTYAQDRTYICHDGDEAKSMLVSVYGDKLGEEAYCAVKNAPVGSTFRKNGGPLVLVVTKERAEEIREKERAIGMI